MRSESADVVILGTGIAALCAAAAVRTRYKNIVLIERSSEPVAQASHGHNLVTLGYRLFQDLFPGWEQELAGHDVPTLDWGNDVELLGFYDWHLRSPSEFRTRSLSRTLLEAAVKKTVLKFPEVRIVAGTWDALELQNGRVSGVRGEGLSIQTPFVIDASGKSSRMSQVLKALGCGETEVTTVDSKVCYVSALVRLKNPPASKMVFITPRSLDIPTAAMLVHIEDGQWMITQVGIGGLVPPNKPDEFIAFAKQLRSPRVHELLQGAEFLTPLTVFANTANRRRWYERLEGFPEGLLALGDSSLALNPIYGQGMSVAAQQAVALKHELASGAKIDRHLQGRVAAASNLAWRLSTERDGGIARRIGAPARKGPRRKPGFAQKLMLKVAAGAARSEILRNAYLGVAHLTATPKSIFAPRVLFSALFQKLPSRNSEK